MELRPKDVKHVSTRSQPAYGQREQVDFENEDLRQTPQIPRSSDGYAEKPKAGDKTGIDLGKIHRFLHKYVINVLKYVAWMSHSSTSTSVEPPDRINQSDAIE